MAVIIDGTPVNGQASGAATATATGVSCSAASIVVACVGNDGNGNGNGTGFTPSISVSGGGLTWQKYFGATATLTGGFPGDAELDIYWAYAPSGLTSQTITYTVNNSVNTPDDLVISVSSYKGFTGTDYHTNPWGSNASFPIATKLLTDPVGTAPSNSAITIADSGALSLIVAYSSDGNNFSTGASGATLVDSVSNTGGSSAGQLGVVSSAGTQSAQVFTFAQANKNWICVAAALVPAGTPSGGGGVVTGWDYIQDDIYPRRVFSVSAAPAFAPKPFVTTNTNAGIPWSGPRDHARLPPGVSLSNSPAFGRPPLISSVPISGMAWDTQHETDRLPKGKYLTDPVSLNYNPATVTWSFLVGDTTFLRDPPIDSPPAFEQPFSAVVNTNTGIPWFEPRDRDRPPTKVFFESLPAAFVSTFKTAPVSGMAWFTPLDWSKAKVSYSQPSAYDVIPPFGVAIAGMAWFEPPDRDKIATKVRIEAPPSIALTPSTLPVGIKGIAWFEPPDRDRPATKIKFDYPPAFVRFPVGNLTLTLSSTESPDLASFAASFRALWVAATKQDETWTPAVKQDETWTPS